MQDFETRDARGVETMNQRCERAISFTGKFKWLPVPKQARLATDRAIAAFGLKTLQPPGDGPLYVFAPKHCLQFSAADLTAKPVNLIVSDGTEFPLHFLG